MAQWCRWQVLRGGWQQLDIIEILKSIAGVFAYQYWFLTVYCIIYILSPGLNYILWSISIKYYKLFLFVIVYATFVLSFVFGNEVLGRTAVGITIYFTIGFLERFPQYNIFKRFSKAGSIFCLFGILVLEIVLSYLGMYFNTFFYKCINRIQITQSPFMLIAGLFVFYLFTGWKIRSSRILSFLGACSVGAYLLHGGPAFMRDWLWDGLFQAGSYYEKSLAEYAVHYGICILSLYLAGVACEFVYTATLGRGIQFLWDRKAGNRRFLY